MAIPMATTTAKKAEGVRKTIRKLDGKFDSVAGKEIFGPWEGEGVMRSLPTPETEIQLLEVTKTSIALEVVKENGLDPEKEAFTRAQVLAFGEEHEDLVPKGGHNGAWLLYREGTTLWWAYIYWSAPSKLGMARLPINTDIALPGHDGHVVIVKVLA